MNSGILASHVKEFAIYDFPFQFANAKEADAVVDGPFGKMMHDKMRPVIAKYSVSVGQETVKAMQKEPAKARSK